MHVTLELCLVCKNYILIYQHEEGLFDKKLYNNKWLIFYGQVEVNICRKEQPFVIQTTSLHDCYQAQYGVEAYTSQFRPVPPNCVTDVMDVESVTQNDINLGASTSRDFDCHRVEHVYCNSRSGKTCLPQRAALLKSMLNFLKKAIQDSSFSDSVRLVMGGSLSSSLRHIISNAEYYGPSLFLLATDVVTVYIFQEPSFLSTLQDNGLTYVILNALLIKDVRLAMNLFYYTYLQELFDQKCSA